MDCVTGERRLLRADLMFDAGRSVSPAIDMGQVRVVGVEKGQGVGVVLVVVRSVDSVSQD